MCGQNGERRCILVVDDDKIIRGYIVQLLRDLFDDEYELIEAYDGQAAVHLMETTRVSIVLTDMRMPRMDGLQLIQAAHERWPWIRFIVLSNYDDFDYVQKSFLFGIVNYVLKYQINAALLSELMSAAIESLCEYERKSAYLEQSQREERVDACLARGREVALCTETFAMPSFLKQVGGRELLMLRLDCAPPENQVDRWGEQLVAAWAELFEGEAGEHFPFALDALHGTLRLRLGLLSVPHTHNPSAHKLRVVELVDELFVRAGRLGCVATAAYALSPWSVPQLLSLSSAAALVYYADNSSIAESPTLNTELMQPGDLFSRFSVALLEGRRDAAAEIITQTADKLKRYKPDPQVAQRIMQRFLREMQPFGAQAGQRLDPVSGERLTTHARSLIGIVDALALEHDGEHYANTAINDLIEQILSNLSSPVTLDEAASRTGFSRTHFCRVFKRATGESFNGFLTRKRVEYACALLQSEDARLCDVSRAVGISDVRYFKKLFNQHMHMTIAEYTRKQRGAARVGEGM